MTGQEHAGRADALRQLITKWRERASQYVRGQSSASEFGRCEALSNCADELEVVLRDSVALLEGAAPVELVRRLMELARTHLYTLPIGAHYCRYCPAKSSDWEHGPSCPYVESQRGYDESRKIIAQLEKSLASAEGAAPAEHLVARILRERADDLTRESCDNCEQCGKLVMCSYHSLLSELAGRVHVPASAEGRACKGPVLP